MSSKPGFRPDIEGLRAVAILLVLLYHAQIPWFPGGFVGVDVFFVISGFLITRSLIDEAESTGTIRLREFYARRIRRLLPASGLALAATGFGVVLALPSSMWRTFGGDVVAAGVYVVNWRFAERAVDYLAQDVVPSPVQHFWSLSIEEQFYLMWPALIIGGIMVARWLGSAMRTSIGLVLLGVVLIPSLAWSIIGTGREPASAFFGTTTRLWELAVGALTAVVGTVAFHTSIRTVIKAVGLALVVVAAVLIDGSVPWPGAAALAPTVGTALLIIAGGGSQDWIQRALSTRQMKKVGALSYSLYLWHWPPLAILAARWGGLTTRQAVLITVASFIPAVIAFKWVENPLRFRESLKASPAYTMALGSSLTLFTVVVGLTMVVAVPINPSVEFAQSGSQLLGAGAITSDADADSLLRQAQATRAFFPSPATATSDRPTLYDEGCQVNQSDSEPVVCERGDPEGNALVMVIGDSKIAQWEPALDIVGRRQGWRVLTVTKSACEFNAGVPSSGGEPYTSCTEWNGRVLDLVLELNPDLIVVSQGSATSWNDETGTSDREAMVEGMLEAYARATAQGSQLAILLNNPHPGIVVRDCVAENPDDLAACAVPLEEVEGGSRTIQREVAEIGGYPILDMTDLICPDGMCLPVIGGVLVYRDGSHITMTYVNSMASALEERLLDLVAPVG